MNKKQKICVITGTRAEYGLLFSLMKIIQADSKSDLQIIATGMHLSPEFGYSYKQIEKDGFKIDKKIEILLSSDSSVGISKSMGLAQISFAEAYSELKPDIIVILGDRFEMFAAAGTALIAKIPLAHIHGGEITEGAYDDAIRHSITNMTHLHFTSTEKYRKRVIQLGESPNRVFNVGAPGIDNIKRLKLLSKNEFEKATNFKLNKKNVLVTFHPVTLEDSSSGEQFLELLAAMDSLNDTNIIFTKANADTGGRIINRMIDEYVLGKQNAIAFTSLGQLRYLSSIKYIDIVIGNSSSGIIEIPSFNKATINIGDRQKGRIQSKSIINCNPTKNAILKAIKIAYSNNFQKILKTVKNPYGNGKTSEKIFNIIKKENLDNILKKHFYDIEG